MPFRPYTVMPPPRKLLFFSQDGKLGDAIVNTAFVAALEGVELHVTTQGATDDFWRHDPRITRTWRLEQAGWLDAIRLGLALRRERFDAIVTWQPQRKEKTRLMLWLAAARRIIDLRRVRQRAPTHKLDDCARALRALGRPVPAMLRYDLRYPLPAAAAMVRMPYVLVNLCAADAQRSIDPATAVRLLTALQRALPGMKIMLTCMPDTRPRLAALIEQCPFAQLADTGGDLGVLFRLVKDAALVVSPDTALVHIASAYGRPLIGIYQNDGRKAIEWAPLSARAVTILGDKPDSIQGFSVAAVAAHAQRLLRIARAA